jgi:hypothetical protein
MITSLQYETALKIISDYIVQTERKLNFNNLTESLKIDIQKNINKSLFNVLKSYYLDEHKITLIWDDLKVMDVNLLQTINFTKLRQYSRFGAMGEHKLQKILIDCLIFEPERF